MTKPKQEAKYESYKVNRKFVNDLCKPNCPKGLTNEDFQCLSFIRAKPWLENEAKDNWEITKPACLVGYQKR